MALGVDEICPEFLKALDVVGLLWRTRLCNGAWTSRAGLLNWQTGVVVPLLRSGTGGCVPTMIDHSPLPPWQGLACSGKCLHLIRLKPPRAAVEHVIMRVSACSLF